MSIEALSIDQIKDRLLARQLPAELSPLSPEQTGVEFYLSSLQQILTSRRSADLRELPVSKKLEFIINRAHRTTLTENASGEQPMVNEIRQHMMAVEQGHERTVLIGIDPTGPQIHLGHAVPLVMVSRLQRMGFKVVFVVGDFTARIGDPTGRSKERKILTEDEIRSNFTRYQEQASRFIDFSQAEIRYNSEWLRAENLGEYFSHLFAIPARKLFGGRRFGTHDSVTTAQVLYPTLMAEDALALKPWIQVAGYDQFDNLDVCRLMVERLAKEGDYQTMSYVTTPLLPRASSKEYVADTLQLDEEALRALELKQIKDKMSKSEADSCIHLQDNEAKIFNTVMSMRDELIFPFFMMLTEIYDSEIAHIQDLVAQGNMQIQDVKRLLAQTIIDTVRGNEVSTSGQETVTTIKENAFFVNQRPDVELPARTLIANVCGYESAGQVVNLIKQKAVRVLDIEAGVELGRIEDFKIKISDLMLLYPDKKIKLVIGGKKDQRVLYFNF